MNEGKELFTLQDGIVGRSFIASSDIHLGHKLYNIPELEDDLTDNFIRLCDLAITKNVDALVIVGDLFDDNQPKPHMISLLKEQSNRLLKAGVTLVGIAGDHDKPIRGETWCSVGGMQPVQCIQSFTGVDYYDYSTSTTKALMERLVSGETGWQPEAEEVHWIFLHAQFPALYQFTEAKKKVDFSEVELFDLFPNLQGVIAGDIHIPLEGRLAEKDREAYIGYCGSLGIIDISEIKHPKSVLYCDGHKLYRLPFAQRRSFTRINFKGDNHKVFDLESHIKYHKDSPYRPVFCIDYDADSEPYLSKIKPLYNLGFVRLSQSIRSVKTGTEEVINIRSEIKTEEKIDGALTECCEGDQEIYSLLSETLGAADPKLSLDTFKAKALA